MGSAAFKFVLKLAWVTWSWQSGANIFQHLQLKSVKGNQAARNRTHFGEAAVDDFFGRSVILEIGQKLGSTSVLMESWNKSVKTADRSLAAYFGGGGDG